MRPIVAVATSDLDGTGWDIQVDNPAAHHLAFVRSGYINLNNLAGSARHVGDIGYGWPRVAVTFASIADTTAYFLDLNTTGVNPSNGPVNRWAGFPLRCLSTALEG